MKHDEMMSSKRRYKLFAIMALLVGVVCCLNMTYAASGKAVFSHWHSRYTTNTWYLTQIFVSNVTGDPATVKITFFDTDGTILQDGTDSVTSGTIKSYSPTIVSNWDDDPSGASVSFDVSGHNTAEVHVDTITQSFGYGLVEWTQGTNNSVALVCHCRCYYWDANAGLSYSTVTLNSGQPF